jgi:demethylmenaquinone methyltransferase/2-methoxy-6-polyprenyl-1,4-benzoquinol methylase
MPAKTLGATPEGAADEQSAAAAVQSMFNSIAPRYDLLNHVLSANIDRLWWAATARRFDAILSEPQAAILDICCGTGDMTMALLKRRPVRSRPILAADFAHEMLMRGEKKFGQRDREQTRPYAIPIEADALHLPLAPASLDLITTAFGFRNLANYRAGLEEFHRVLKPGGQLGILDFSEPGGLIGHLYRIYFRHVLPAIGRLVSGSGSRSSAHAASQPGPYNYLPASVSRFPPPAEMQALMRSVGFESVQWKPYTFGIAGLYTGTKSRP